VYLYPIFLIHSSFVRHLSCFHSLAEINMSVKVTLFYPDLHLFRYMPRSGIAGSYTSYIFSCLRSLHTSHQQFIRVPFSWLSHQCLLFVFLMIAILTEVRSSTILKLGIIQIIIKNKTNRYKMGIIL
jgi:hypothetical protein